MSKQFPRWTKLPAVRDGVVSRYSVTKTFADYDELMNWVTENASKQHALYMAYTEDRFGDHLNRPKTRHVLRYFAGDKITSEP